MNQKKESGIFKWFLIGISVLFLAVMLVLPLFVVLDVNFGIEKGKLIGLLGPSGSGKTTILRMIAGLETPDSGEIIIDGKKVNDIPASKRGIGFVFQNYALFRYMSVYENIAFGLRVQKSDKKYIDERVKELISLIGLRKQPL